MSKTTLGIQGTRFTINGELVYSEIPKSNPIAHGLLMNARFIQGVFDDAADPSRFIRWGRDRWDPEANTDDLIAALPEWYRYGLRAFTVGFQGGGPVYTIPNPGIDNNPFGEDGKRIDPKYLARMDRLIRAADALGMVVIVSYFYNGQAQRMRDGRAFRDATITASRFLKENGYTNVMIEVANENEIGQFRTRPVISNEESMVLLMDLARTESGGMPVGCSGGGGTAFPQIVKASDVVLIHGNGLSRQCYYNLIHRVQSLAPGRPVLCNEDSHAIGQLKVAYATGTSWGYYNNFSKQEPPTNWGVLPGDDQFFAHRMAEGIGIPLDPVPEADQFVLQGLEPETEYQGKRWIRLACLYPEAVDFVEFLRNGKHYYTCYDEPFMVDWHCNYSQGAVETQSDDNEWSARIHLRSGEILERSAPVPR
ncbi:MAG: hypothetical protein JJU00_11515 [Opitutales bacterium]|nr:hypothetical protein [Opitutales bacterium]